MSIINSFIVTLLLILSPLTLMAKMDRVKRCLICCKSVNVQICNKIGSKNSKLKVHGIYFSKRPNKEKRFIAEHDPRAWKKRLAKDEKHNWYGTVKGIRCKKSANITVKFEAKDGGIDLNENYAKVTRNKFKVKYGGQINLKIKLDSSGTPKVTRASNKDIRDCKRR